MLSFNSLVISSSCLIIISQYAFSSLLDLGFIDTFRYIYPETIKYSWWSYRFNSRARNAGWRIDYFLVSSRFIDNVADSLILNDINGSDHCPIELIIKD